MGVHLAADCAGRWFNILRSIHYNYSCFRLEWRATPCPWNGIVNNYSSSSNGLAMRTRGIIILVKSN